MSGACWLVLAALLWAAPAAAGDETAPGGFSLEKLRVPRDSIVAGGPGRDGIKSVDEPAFVSPEEATWVLPTTTVLGVAAGGEARAYPVHLIEYHQIVNDTLGDVPVAVTYDPLTGVPRAFRRRVEGRTLDFGVSGLVHNSSFLLYDRQTQSLWLQFSGEALAGPLAGKRLEPLGVRQEIRDLWLARQPESRILARPFPRRIDYRYSPFKTYWVSDQIPYPVAARDASYHPKELVLGVAVGEVVRAYLGSVLTAAGGRALDEVGGVRIQVDYDTNLAAFAWDAPDGVEVTEAYWFAWKAFHPGTEIWKPEGLPGS